MKRGGATPQGGLGRFLEEMTLKLRSEGGAEVSSMKRGGKTVPKRGSSTHRVLWGEGTWRTSGGHVQAGEVERGGHWTRPAGGARRARLYL